MEILKQTFQEFMDDDCPSMAAALAYYTVFSLPALLVLIILIGGLMFDPGDVRGHMVGQIRSLIGERGSEQVREILEAAQDPGPEGLFASLAGFGALLFGATGAFVQLQSALNRAWEVEPDPRKGGVRNFISKRLLSFGMILGVFFLLLVSLALSALLTAFGSYMGQFLPDSTSVVTLMILNGVLSFVVIALLFAAIFKVIPDALVSWMDVWAGGTATALLFVAGKGLLGFYLGRSNPGSAFGAAGSLIVILVWIYYSSMIFLLGAEFTQVWARSFGRVIEPDQDAVRVIRERKRIRD